MLTFGGQDFQYFRVVRFDFHLARAPDDYWILEAPSDPMIRVADVDHRAGRVLLRDTKNRSDHKLLLSRQALEIAKRNCAGRKADEPLFPIVDARKTLSWINEEAGTKVQGHGLRATFASIAEELVSSALLKRMMNHAAAGDVTLGR